MSLTEAGRGSLESSPGESLELSLSRWTCQGVPGRGIYSEDCDPKTGLWLQGMAARAQSLVSLGHKPKKAFKESGSWSKTRLINKPSFSSLSTQYFLSVTG